MNREQLYDEVMKELDEGYAKKQAEHMRQLLSLRGKTITERHTLDAVRKTLEKLGYTKPIESASVAFTAGTAVRRPGAIVVAYTSKDESIEGIYAGFDSTIGAHAVIYVSLTKAADDKKDVSNNRRLEYTTLVATYSKPDKE